MSTGYEWVIDLDYEKSQKIYVRARNSPDIERKTIRILLRLCSQEGVQHSVGSTLQHRGFSSVGIDDVGDCLNPAYICAGLVQADADRAFFANGDALVIGTPRFFVDGSEIVNALPFGFWGRDVTTCIDYVMLKPNLLREINEEAIRSEAKITSWHVVFA